MMTARSTSMAKPARRTRADAAARPGPAHRITPQISSSAKVQAAVRRIVGRWG